MLGQYSEFWGLGQTERGGFLIVWPLFSGQGLRMLVLGFGFRVLGVCNMVVRWELFGSVGCRYFVCFMCVCNVGAGVLDLQVSWHGRSYMEGWWVTVFLEKWLLN